MMIAQNDTSPGGSAANSSSAADQIANLVEDMISAAIAAVVGDAEKAEIRKTQLAEAKAKLSALVNPAAKQSDGKIASGNKRRPKAAVPIANLPHQLRDDADELNGCGAGNEAEHARQAAEAIEGLRRDLRHLAHYIAGATPDANTQTPEEMEKTEMRTEEIVRKAKA